MLVLLEHQAKQLLADAGFTVPESLLLAADDVVDIVRERIGAPPWMVKAQVRGQRRASWGGVVRVASEEELVAARAALFAWSDQVFERVLVERYRPVEREWLCAVALDASSASMRIILTPHGGASADHALASGQFVSLAFDPAAPPEAARIDAELDVGDPRVSTAAAALARVAVERDLVLLELNPFGVDATGAVVVLDVHATADEAAEFRQPWLAACADEIAALDPDVAWRRRWDGDFFVLDEHGDVALINTGAGAGLFLLDELERRGLRALNFSDVRMAGIIRQPERMNAVVDRIRSSQGGRVVLVNVHAGIGDPLETVHLLVSAARELRASGRTIVVRLAGRNAERAARILADEGFTVRMSLRDALDEVQALASTVRA